MLGHAQLVVANGSSSRFNTRMIIPALGSMVMSLRSGFRRPATLVAVACTTGDGAIRVPVRPIIAAHYLLYGD